MTTNKLTGRGFKPLPRLLVAGMLALPLTACDRVDSLLDIQDPDVINPELLTNESALPAFLAAAVGEFGVALDQQILYSGLLGDEWFHSGTFPTRTEVDIRNIQATNATLEGVTRNLYQARTQAEETVRAYEKFERTGPGLAEAQNLAALTYVMFAENYCSGVPFSRLNADGTFEFGGQETTTQILQRAISATDRVLGLDDAGAAQTALAKVAKGRTLLNLGQFQEAAAAVSGVPTGFLYFIAHSENTGRENNSVYSFNVLQERWSAANNEAGEGLPYRSAFAAGDPRTPWRRAPANDVGFDRVTPQYDALKYNDRSSRTPVASGVEARLIEAEAELRAGNNEEFLEILNDLRANAPTILAQHISNFAVLFPGAEDLDELQDPGSEKARVDMLFQERAFWLWLTSHRLGDMRRLLRQYADLGYTEDTVFPTGEYHKSVQGGFYGDDVNLPLSVDERNNPELAGIPTGEDLCLDRNP